MFQNLVSIAPSSEPLTLATLIAALILAFILSLISAWVYRATHRGLSYSQSFTFTLILLGILMAAIIMVIGNSLAIAVGAFGAFSLIRFRTAIKDTKDVAFVLLVVAIGLAVGSGNYLIAIVTTTIALTVVYFLTKFNFGSIRKYDYLLNFSVVANELQSDRMRNVFDKYLKYDNLLNVNTKEGGQILDYSFNIKFIKAQDMELFISEMTQMEGVSDIDIISAKNDIEY